MIHDNNSYVKKFLECERRFHLMDFKYRNKYPMWPFYRMYFHYRFLHSIGARGRLGSRFQVSHLFRKLIVLIFNSKLERLLSLKNKKYVIISSQRYQNGGEIYTSKIKALLAGDFVEFSFSQYFSFHKGPIYLDLCKIVFKLISRLAFGFVSKKKIQNFTSFFVAMNAASSFQNDFRRAIVEYVLWFKFYESILKQIRPKSVYYVGGVYFSPMVAAAESLSIATYEVQHGVVNRLHLAYQFPGYNRDGYFAHKLLMLSDYWRDKADFPTGVEFATIGSDFFSVKREVIKKKKTIMIVSGPTIADRLIDYVDANKEFLKREFEVFYKLHPAEAENWGAVYPGLSNLEDSDILTVVVETPGLKDLLAFSEYVIGVSSTVVYEALDLGCKVLVLELGDHYFDDLISKNICKLLSFSIPLSMSAFDFENCRKPEHSFFDEFDPSALPR